MANQDNDELARALAGLANGEHSDPSESAAGGTHEPPPQPQPPPAPPRATRPAQRPPASAPPRAVAPGTARPAGPAASKRPAPPGSPQRPPAPGAPQRPPAPGGSQRTVASGGPARPSGPGTSQKPGSPVSRPASPASAQQARPAAPRTLKPQAPRAAQSANPAPARPQRAADPTRAPSPTAEIPGRSFVEPSDVESQHVEQAEAMTHVVEDDDSVNVPAAPMEYLGHARAAPQHKRIAMMTTKTLEARRTAIPILLVCGFMFALAGVLKFVVGDESPISDFPIWMPIMLFVLAGASIIIAVLNMLYVSKTLAAQVSADPVK